MEGLGFFKVFIFLRCLSNSLGAYQNIVDAYAKGVSICCINLTDLIANGRDRLHGRGTIYSACP